LLRGSISDDCKWSPEGGGLCYGRTFLAKHYDYVSLTCVVFVIKSYGTALTNTNSYLVDPASSHMLVSKIKPCMSKYKHLYTVKLRTAHYISNYLFDG
jgi:hypothetical protein